MPDGESESGPDRYLVIDNKLIGNIGSIFAVMFDRKIISLPSALYRIPSQALTPPLKTKVGER